MTEPINLEDAWTWWDDDPTVAWDVPESAHGRIADLLEQAGWERCYHRQGARFHFDVKLDGNERYQGMRARLREIERERPAFDSDDLDEWTEMVGQSEQEMWWDDVPYNLAEHADAPRPKVYGCGRSGGYVNIPEWETAYRHHWMLAAADYLTEQMAHHRSAEAGRYLVDEALERYDDERMAALASARPDRVEA